MEENAKQNWVERAKQGESAAIVELYNHYWRAARAIAYGVIGDLSSAEDVASEAFYEAVNCLHTLKDTNKFGPWLRTIVIRTTKHYNVEKSRDNGLETHVLQNTKSISPSSKLEQHELVALVHEAVGNLPEIQREAICLFYFEGYRIQEASQFLDIPVGTLKRRLYDGRRSLHEAAKQIFKGQKPNHSHCARTLKQLKDFIDNGGDSEAFHQVIQNALRLRPMPYDLMSKLMQRHSKVAKKMASPEGRKEVIRTSQQIMEFVFQPSPRALDPDHAVGKAANSIRTSLPEFKEWQIDISKSAQSLVQRFTGDVTSFELPPGFREGHPGSYVYAIRGSFVPDEAGYMRTMYEYAQNKDFKNLNDRDFIYKSRFSDTLVLMWMRLGTIELKSVEELLRQLSHSIVPQMKIRFLTHEEPRYRSALRMELGDIPIPSAIGGPLVFSNSESTDTSMACIQLYLEAWASAQSGQIIELPGLSSLLKNNKNKLT